jgi:hypothetical protein
VSWEREFSPPAVEPEGLRLVAELAALPPAEPEAELIQAARLSEGSAPGWAEEPVPRVLSALLLPFDLFALRLAQLGR